MTTQQQQRPASGTATPKRRPPTPEQVRAEQTRQAEKDRAATPANLPAVVPETPSMPALGCTADYFRLDGGRMTLGRPVRANLKLGRWLYADAEDEELPTDGKFIVRVDGIWHGWTRLEDGVPPVYEGALFFNDGFTQRARAELGDLDPAQWPSGQFGVKDPWLLATYVPLEPVQGDSEPVTLQLQYPYRKSVFFAVKGLLETCAYHLRRSPDCYPIIKLGIASYESKLNGRQYKPTFRSLGTTPKTGTVAPDAGSLKNDLNDELPYDL